MTIAARRTFELDCRWRWVAGTLLGCLLWCAQASGVSASTTAPIPEPLPNLDIRRAGTVVAAALQDDGKWLIAGSFDRVQGVARSGFARLNPDGSLDASFSPSVSGSIEHLALGQDGIFIAGAFSAVDGLARPGLAKLDFDGRLVEQWNVEVVRTSVEALGAGSDGWVWIGGTFGSVNGQERRFLARVNDQNGELGPSTHPNWGNVTGIKVLPSGVYVFIAGLGGIRRLDLVGGAHDPSWRPAGSFNLPLLFSGEYMYARSGVALRRIELATGNLDSTAAWSVVLPSGTSLMGVDAAYIYAASTLPASNSQELVRIGLEDASIDSNGNLLAIRGSNLFSLYRTDELLFVAGELHAYGDAPALGIAALSTLDHSLLWEGGVESEASVDAVAHMPDGSHLIGGTFTAIEGRLREGLARLLPDGSLDPQWVVSLEESGSSGSVSLIATFAENVYIAGAFRRVNGVAQNRVARLSASGQLEQSFSPPGLNIQDLLVTENAIFAGLPTGYALAAAGGVTTNPVKLDPGTGAVDPTWRSEHLPGSGGVMDMELDGDQIVVAGAPESTSPGNAHGLARLSASDGSLIEGFQPVFGRSTFPLSVKQVLLDGDAIYAVAGTGLYKIRSSDGSPYPDWQPVGAFGDSLVRAGDLLISGGLGELSLGDATRRALAAFDLSNGELSHRWKPQPDGRVRHISTDPGGRVWIGGAFSLVSGLPRPSLAVLSPFAPPSSDTSLASLGTSLGPLSVDDDQSYFELDATPGAVVFAITATAVDPRATLRFEGRRVESARRSHEVQLNWGRNEFLLSVLADDGASRRDIQIVVNRQASRVCDASEEADLVLEGVDVSSSGSSIVTAAHVLNRGPNSAGANYATPFGGAVTFSLAYRVIAPDGQVGPLYDLATASRFIEVGETATRARVLSYHSILRAEGEVEVTLDYFCDPDRSNNALRFRLPQDPSAPPSSESRLYSVSSSAGEFRPLFSPDVSDYRLEVGESWSQVELRSIPFDVASEVRVDGRLVSAPDWSTFVDLPIGNTAIDVSATAPNGQSTSSYRLLIERVPAPQLHLACSSAALAAGPGASVDQEFAMTATNAGSAPVERLRIRAEQPVELTDAGWSCVGPYGCSPEMGTGQLQLVVPFLLPGQRVDVSLSGGASATADFVEFQAEVWDRLGELAAHCRILTSPSGLGVYRDGFER